MVSKNLKTSTVEPPVKPSKGKKVLVVAGSDPSAGAGMQADLATLKDFEVPAVFAVTAITAQSDEQVLSIYPTPADLLTQQLAAASQGQEIVVIKIGMLATAANVRALLWYLPRFPASYVIVDPIFHSSSGTSLLENRAMPLFRQQLLPMATVVTPNLPEASALLGRQIATVEQMKTAAQDLYREWKTLRGGAHPEKPLAVVIKGGHLKGRAVDVLYDGENLLEWEADHLPGRSPRGTGCRFASAIAAQLFRGIPVTEAVAGAKKYLTEYISKST